MSSQNTKILVWAHNYKQRSAFAWSIGERKAGSARDLKPLGAALNHWWMRTIAFLLPGWNSFWVETMFSSISQSAPVGPTPVAHLLYNTWISWLSIFSWLVSPPLTGAPKKPTQNTQLTVWNNPVFLKGTECEDRSFDALGYHQCHYLLLSQIRGIFSYLWNKEL